MIVPTMIQNLSSLPLSLPLADFWFPESASTNAEVVDSLFYGILWICIVFFVLIVGLMIAFLAKYRARPGHKEEHTAHHNNALEALWSIIPSLLLIPIFGYGFIGYLDLRTPQEGALEIEVIAKKWAWAFRYPNGHIDEDLHVPLDEPVKLVMSSDDVLHSLYIPAFRVKMDCVPGRYSKMWFQATRMPRDRTEEEGQYGEDAEGFDLFCTEYCGTGHSAMLAKVIVHESGTYEAWLEKAIEWLDSESPAERGLSIYKKRGCAGCHSIDGRAGTGPSFKNIYGAMHEMADGSQVEVDENYIRESVLNPMAKIRAGYQPVMPSFQGQLKDRDIAALIWFIKSLKEGSEVPTTWNDAGGIPGAEPAPEGEATAEPVEEPTG